MAAWLEWARPAAWHRLFQVTFAMVAYILLVVLALVLFEFGHLLGMTEDVKAIAAHSRESVRVLSSKDVAEDDKEAIARFRSVQIFKVTFFLGAKLLLCILFVLLIFRLFPRLDGTSLVSPVAITVLTVAVVSYAGLRHRVSTRFSGSAASIRMRVLSGEMLPRPIFYLIFLCGGLLTVAFGYVVSYTASGNTRFGHLGEVALAIASFPDQVEDSLNYATRKPEWFFQVSRPNVSLANFHPVVMKQDIHVEGLIVRADKSALARSPGWRILVGNFMMAGEMTAAALALSPSLEIVKVWKFKDELVPGGRPQSTSHKLLDGFAILKDGSMMVTFIRGISIQRFDNCGKRLWSTPGEFNHSITLEADERFAWTVNGGDRNTELVKLSTAAGEPVRRIRISDVIAANPLIDILGIRPESDPFHINDVDPLPAALADRFGDFTAGDLLVSARALNLLFVVDPETRKVKWWHSGSWRRQHDPDWESTGEITVYDNRMGRGFSRIVGIEPTSGKSRVLFDGRSNDFYSTEAGKHQITRTGNMLVSSSMQGRAFEVDQDGRLVFDLLNTKPGTKGLDYFLSEVIWLPLEDFDFEKDVSCAK